jgi:valine dehydrogenase (NAD+)
MDIIARECEFVTGRSPEDGGAGDSSVLTALGVFQGMRAAAEQVWGSPELRGRRVGVVGAGKVGHILVGHLVESGAQVVITDVAPKTIERILAAYPGVEVVADADRLTRSDIDVFAPCALGGALNDETVVSLRAKIVCGAANNQLSHPGIDKLLDDRGILFAPDYLVNAGGAIQVSDELRGFDFARAKRKTTAIFDTAKAVFALAKADGVPPATAADRLAERRMSEVGRLRSILTG